MTDDKMLDRVRKLLAKAERASTEHEAETYTAKATELMLKYAIDEAMLQAEHKSDEKIVTFRVEVVGYAKAKLTLMHRVAAGLGMRSVEYTNSRSGWSKGTGQVMGWESDVESFKVLFASLQMQATHEAKRAFTELRATFDDKKAAWEAWSEAHENYMHENIYAVRRAARLVDYNANPIPYAEAQRIEREWRDENPEPENPGRELPHGRAFNQSFLIGYAGVVGNRLWKLRQETVKVAEDERPGTALAVINRKEAVDLAYTKAHPPSSFVSGGRGASNSANAGYYAGRAAGGRANIGSQSVGGGHRAIGR